MLESECAVEEDTEFREAFDPVVDKPWRWVLNCGALLLLALMVFLVAFFA
jgi:hypothetical protein